MKKRVGAKSPRISTDSQQDIAVLCKAMAHPIRVGLIMWLEEQGGTQGWVCNELVKHLPIAESTASEHLRILRESGLLIREIHGKNSRYRVDRDKLASFKCMISCL